MVPPPFLFSKLWNGLRRYVRYRHQGVSARISITADHRSTSVLAIEALRWPLGSAPLLRLQIHAAEQIGEARAGVAAAAIAPVTVAGLALISLWMLARRVDP